ncbi:acetyltransferase [Flavobacterium sp. ANB]|uniref:acetyltransferase n=1 Tax=unclassified Flavobacterium TaxID=196869 RepID=UPI001395869B|nr:acetyltransferase [Flavobacterium sp. ANB]MBF4517633.1 acetyltransferase [Flavobacterium sp. ANB]MTD70360.1 N-acetylneuraminate synthase [Flavobacterium sp. LC2016-13]
MSDKKVILIGYSGHGYVVAETALEHNLTIVGYFEKNEQKNNPFNIKYLGFEEFEGFLGWNEADCFILGIGDNTIRQKVASLITSKKKNILPLVHSSALIAKSAKIGQGTFINKNVSINALAIIGENSILNTGCIIEHECVLHDAVHIAPGAVLAGNVQVGERTFIGANAVVKQGITIGKDVIIGAGSVVLKDVLDNEIWFGNPARKK